MSKLERAAAIGLLRERGPNLWLALGVLRFFLRRFRDGAKKGLLGYIARGACLRPWLIDSELVFFDTTLPPQHGDLVLTRVAFTMRAGFGTPPRAIEKFGCHQLRIDQHGRRWLTCADGAYQPDGASETILGVATVAGRRPWRRGFGKRRARKFRPATPARAGVVG